MEIDAEAVRSLIRAKVAQYKNLKQAAWMIGLHEQYLGEILNGHRPPGLKVLKLLGVKRVMRYEVVCNLESKFRQNG